MCLLFYLAVEGKACAFADFHGHDGTHLRRATLNDDRLVLRGAALQAVRVVFAGAFLYRYAYTHNAPADLDAYEKEHKHEEDPDALVTVAECNDSSSAHIIKGMLESNGIPVEIFGDGLSEPLGVGKHSMPIRVLVRKRDKAAAEELINE